MSIEAKLFPGNDAGKNQEAIAILRQLFDEGEISVIRDGPLLEGKVLLPFVELDDGSRRYGIHSIRKLAEKRKS